MILKIDDLLVENNTTRDILIDRNPDYRAGFDKLDEYQKAYTENPNPAIEQKFNNTVTNYFKKIQKENPDLFSETEPVKKGDDVPPVPAEPEVKPVDPKKEGKDQYQDQFMELAEAGDTTGLDELLTDMNPEQAKRLFTSQNFKAIHTAANVRNPLMTIYLLDQGDRLGILSDMIMARGGKILSNIISMKEIPPIVLAIKGLKNEPELAKPLLKKAMVLEQAMETEDDQIVALFEALYQEIGMPTGERKPTEKLKEEKSIKSVIDSVRSGQILLDVSLIAGMEKRLSIAVLDSPEDIASGADYQYIVPTQHAGLFDDKVMAKAEDYTLFQAKSNDFERRFGCTVYEFGFAWFNMLNLMNVGDVISMMHIANIAPELLVERYDKELRDAYRSDIAALIQYPENSKIGGQSYQVTQSNIKNLQRAGFLDSDYCPTKMMYCAIVLHAFSFPEYTHPFELINVPSIDNIFQFNVLKGEYGNEVFFTDGDILYQNFTRNISGTSNLMMLDIARTMILNIKSQSVGDIEKSEAKIHHFLPLFYSVPKSNVSIPTFSIHMLEIENRNINWGVYEFRDAADHPVLVNSIGISNFQNQYRNEDVKAQVYDGALSHQIFSNPKSGIILSHKKLFLCARALNGTSFMTANYGENHEVYYKAMFGKEVLQKNILDQLEPVFVKALFTTPTLRIDSIRPNLVIPVPKKVETPYVPEKTVKAPPQKDDRIYLSQKDARELIVKNLWPVFDAVQNIKGEQRDEAILDNMLSQGVDMIRPRQLLYLGFDLERWKVSATTLKFKDKYRLRIPNLGFMYYLEKI